MSIVSAENKTFATSVPVIVVGAGACGLTAALACADEDTAVLVLERDQHPSGSTGISYGAICAAGSRLQQEMGVEDSPDSLFQDILTAARAQTDERLARTLSENAAATVDWLTESHGIQLSLEMAWTGLGHSQPRLHAPKNRSGTELMNMLLSAAEKPEIDILTEAHVQKLYKAADGRVVGVAVARPDGTIEEVSCEALIIATCGFGANPDWVQKYIPELADARYYGHEGNVGEGIQWGQELGGALADMGSYQALGSLADPQALVIPHTLMIGGGVQINLDGERFEDELSDISGQALTVLAQPGKCCWIVYDERLHQDALSRFLEYQQAAEIRAVKSAPTWAELAKEMKLSPEALATTMKDVNERAVLNAADKFGRQFVEKQQLVPPYFAIRVTGALFHTQGGLVVDEKARVQTVDGDSLPNVFAGGGAARSVSGPGGWGYLPAMGLCTAVTLGRIAGTEAARLVARKADLT